MCRRGLRTGRLKSTHREHSSSEKWCHNYQLQRLSWRLRQGLRPKRKKTLSETISFFLPLHFKKLMMSLMRAGTISRHAKTVFLRILHSCAWLSVRPFVIATDGTAVFMGPGGLFLPDCVLPGRRPVLGRGTNACRRSRFRSGTYGRGRTLRLRDRGVRTGIPRVVWRRPVMNTPGHTQRTSESHRQDEVKEKFCSLHFLNLLLVKKNTILVSDESSALQRGLSRTD